MEYTKKFLYKMKYNLEIGKSLSKKKYNLEDKNADLTTKSSKEYNLKDKNLSTKSSKKYKDKPESSYEYLNNRRHSL